jgi:predicted DNA-binding antitoxin AbrB/MazE fold protein
MIQGLKTVEAVYEAGYLRPLEPIEERPGLVYIVTIVDLHAMEESQTKDNQTLRGKYQGYLSQSHDFAQRKQVEKSLEQ